MAILRETFESPTQLKHKDVSILSLTMAPGDIADCFQAKELAAEIERGAASRTLSTGTTMAARIRRSIRFSPKESCE